MHARGTHWTTGIKLAVGFVAGALFTVMALNGGGVLALKNAVPKRVVLQEEALEEHPEKIVRMLSLEFGPDTTSMPHRHPGPVFGYVVSGAIRTSIGDGPVTEYRAGESFYEPAMALHGATENRSETEPAHVIAVLVLDKDAPELTLEH